MYTSKTLGRRGRMDVGKQLAVLPQNQWMSALKNSIKKHSFHSYKYASRWRKRKGKKKEKVGTTTTR